MAGKNRNNGPHGGPTGMHGGPAHMLPPHGAMMPPLLGHPQGLSDAPIIIEQKLATQHAEIQRLLMENQRFAATHVALRQELAAAQQEIQRLQEILGKMETENDQRIRELVDKTGLMEADLRAMEPLRIDLERLSSERQELRAQIQHLTQEAQRAHGDLKQIPLLRREVDGLNEELQLARLAFEQERKASTGLSEQKHAMEKNMISLAREIEKLRTELASAEKRAVAASSAVSGGTAAYYNSAPQNAYGNDHPAMQAGALGSSNIVENKIVPEASKYSSWPNSSSHNTAHALRERVENAGDWSVHTAPNGQTYYYNASTGVTQLEKPAAFAAAEGQPSIQGGQPTQQGILSQGSQVAAPYQQKNSVPMQQQSQDAAYALGSQHSFPQMQSQVPSGRGQNQPATWQTQQQQPTAWAGQAQSNATIAKPGEQTNSQQNLSSPANSHAPQGISLIVQGIPDDFTDIKLAELFIPFGPVHYAKILLDKETGRKSGSGYVTMDNPQGAEAAANAINGMPASSGKRLRVELDRREIEMYYHQQQQLLLQAQSTSGGAAPGRWNTRNEFQGSRPY